MSLPPLIVLALVAVLALAAARRRQRAIASALHELRRPLHALSISPAALEPPVEGQVDLARLALDDLESALEGTARRPVLRTMDGKGIVAGAVLRWRDLARARGGAIRLDWRAGDARVLADPLRLAQALDNLLANALEHGGPAIKVRATASVGRLRIAVLDSGGTIGSQAPRGPRRGHGLAIVSHVAKTHGGRVALRRGAHGSVAVLELPLVGRPLAAPAAPIAG